MAESNRELLEKEIAHYTNLLKKYESSKSSKLQCETKQQLPGSSHWKHPVVPVYKIAANSTHPSSLLNGPSSYNKLHLSKLNTGRSYQNNRTVIYNPNTNFKAKYVPAVQSHTSRSLKPPAENINKSLVKGNLSHKYKVILSDIKSNLEKKQIALSKASKNISSSNSQDLMKEITDVINQLKTKSKIMCSKTKDTANKQTITKTSESSNLNALNNCKTVSNDNMFSKNNVKSVYKISSNSPNSSLVSCSKLNSVGKTNANSSHNPLSTFSKKHPKSFHLSKYSYENSEKQTMKLKSGNFPLKENATKNLTADTEQENMAVSQLLGPVKRSVCGINVPNTDVLQHDKVSIIQPKITVLSCQVNDKKLDITKDSSKYKVERKEFVDLSKVESSVKCDQIPKLDMTKESSKYKMAKKEFVNLSKVKSPVVSNIKIKSGNIYSKVNKGNSLKLNKSEGPKTPLNARKMKRKVNMKYKVINQTNSSLNRKIVNVKNNQRSKESSSLLVDKSDPLYELLHESSTIDKLEQELLAKSSALINPPKPSSKEKQISKTQGTLSNINSKFCLKRTPLKRSKVLASKYKVINKTLKTPQSYSLKRKSCTPLKNSAKKLSNKAVYSKFAIINKQPTYSPVIKGKSILVKRLYKSKNTIINKNSSPSNLSAKIKSKYLALRKRRSPVWQKHVLYLKGPVKPQKFKGSYRANRMRLKHFRFQKTTLVNHHKVARKFSSYRINNQHFSTNRRKNIWLRRKSVAGQDEIRKTSKRIVIGGKSYVKTGHTLKAALPSSTSLASRALHRSINRVLTASTKKSLRKVNTYCMFYNRFGRCNRGVKCTYIHDPSKIAVCTRFLRGTCKIDGCPFSHEVSPGKMAICTFFLLGTCEKENCPYRHEKLSPDADLCKAFVQGYCPSGKECNKAHILICPKFIQGACDRGSSCAYPHPPQKAKKNVQNEVDEKDDKNFDDAWLEKVARYFQPCEELPLNCKTSPNKMSQVLPKRARLEEQPSFIPLCDTPVSSKTEESCHLARE